MQKISPCLWFDGNAQEAAEFYISVFPNSRINNVIMAPASGTPSNEPGSVMVVEFTLDGEDFVGLNGGPHFTFSEAISFQIYLERQDEVDRYWAALTEGGEPGPCGWLKDRFGLSWQVIPAGMAEIFADPDPARAQRAVQAMLQMTKLDVAALRAAADGVPVG